MTRIRRLTLPKLLPIIIYVLISIGFYMAYQLQVVKRAAFNEALMFFELVWPLMFIVIFHRQLRDWRVYLVWLTIGIIQAIVCNMVSDMSFLKLPRGTSADAMLALPVGLTLYQACRQISLTVCHHEFIFIYKGMSRYDEVERRNFTPWDVTFSLIIFLGTVLIPELF